MDKKQLKYVLRRDKENNIGSKNTFHIIYIFLTRNPSWLRWKYIKYMRLSSFCRQEYLKNKLLWLFPYLLFQILKNKLGYKLNFEIGGTNIGSGLTLCHNGPVVIHGKAIIGDDCILHGDNCIGNDGITDLCPIIGNNVNIGVGAKIIGGVTIADNVVIGAGAIVINDFLDEGSVIAGIPAKRIK